MLLRMLRSLLISALAGTLGAALPTAVAALPETREETVEVRTEEGLRLEGVLVVADVPAVARRPVVVLLHDLARDRDSLLPAVDALAARGLAVLSLDLRGHGRSRTQGESDLYTFQVRPAAELHRIAADIGLFLAALRARTDLDAGRVGLLGVGHGALAAAETAARLPAVKALVLVDIAAPVVGFRPEHDLGLFGARPALLVASALPNSRARTEALAGYGGGPREVFTSALFELTDRVLREDPAALERTAAWFARWLPPAGARR